MVIVGPRYVPSNLLCLEALSLSNATSLFCLIRCLTLGDKADVRGAASNLLSLEARRFSNTANLCFILASYLLVAALHNARGGQAVWLLC